MRCQMTLSIVLSLGIASSAGDIELVVGKAHEGTLGAGETQAFRVSLDGGDFAQLAIDPHAKVLVGRTYGPSGRGFAPPHWALTRADSTSVARAARVYIGSRSPDPGTPSLSIGS